MFPARAGMSRVVTPEAVMTADVPRASGDEPSAPLFGSVKTKCSPRERG